jgi:hypothetical protein
MSWGPDCMEPHREATLCWSCCRESPKHLLVMQFTRHGANCRSLGLPKAFLPPWLREEYVAVRQRRLCASLIATSSFLSCHGRKAATNSASIAAAGVAMA